MGESSVDAWFVGQVLPLEAALERFIRRHCHPSDEVNDLRQEVYVRVYAAARGARPLLTKPFVFMTARNLLRDRARRARIVSIEAVADLEALNAVGEDAPVDRVISAREELRRVQAALDMLPPRCRQVVVLRKIHGLSQREVARELKITEDTVERQVSKGVRALAAALYSASPAGDLRERLTEAKEKGHDEIEQH
jgi:RNA polymerase sigma factor (sigma-70 family)